MHFFISTNTHYFHILFAHLKEKKKERKKEIKIKFKVDIFDRILEKF